MNTKLNQIQNWEELARRANWSVAGLARLCTVSPRTMERHFLKHLEKSPKAWLAERRQRAAMELLRDGRSVKETAAHLGYKQAGNFTRKFTQHWGKCPASQFSQPKTGGVPPVPDA